MSSENYFTLKEFQLNNNCPECYNNEGLKLTIKQKISDSIFVKRITDDTKSDIYCNNCNTDIYPQRWNDDIERVVDYHKRITVLRKKTWTLKPLTYILILVDVLIITIIVLFMMDIF